MGRTMPGEEGSQGHSKQGKWQCQAKATVTQEDGAAERMWGQGREARRLQPCLTTCLITAFLFLSLLLLSF